MRKRSILIRKLHRAYKNKDNQKYSISKGYPKDTYFGYSSFDNMKKDILKEFEEYYGKGLKYWKLR